MSGLVNNLVNTVLGAPAWLVYLIIALVVFAEDALFVGFVLPGETLAVIGGVTASLGHTSLSWVLPKTSRPPERFVESGTCPIRRNLR